MNSAAHPIHKRIIRVLPALLACLTYPAPPAAAQSDRSALEGPGYVEMHEAREIALARSAAPESVSDAATIWLLRNGTFVPAIEGSNGNHCLTMRSYPKSVEPLCYDAEAARTIMPIEIRRFELRNHGLGWSEIDARIDEEIRRGSLNLPDRPAMSYMLSSAQDLYAPDGRHVGNWKPHIMLYTPGLSNEDIGLTAQGTDFMQMAESGRPIAHLIVVVPDFVEPDGL
jgi:hypothetical protein